MYAAERQQEIVDRARRDGRVDVATLAEELAVTTETVRRDLDQLERQGLVRRVHGGALPVERLRLEAEVSERALAMAAEKERIAKAALAHVPHEGTVLIDAGTTTARLAELLPDDRELTVVTNSLPIALTLATRLRLTVLTVGGRVRGKTLAQVDRWALRSLAEIRVDVAFLATNGGVPLSPPWPRQSRIWGFGQTVLTESPYVHRGMRAPARAGRAP
jgi:DeoR family transcriptional regulator, fructose operon transcriptional repressor